MRISRKALLLAIPLFALPLIGQAADGDAGATNPGLHRDLGRDHRREVRVEDALAGEVLELLPGLPIPLRGQRERDVTLDGDP